MFQFQYFRKILTNFSTKKGLLHYNTFYISYVTVANGPILTVILHLNWKNAIIYSLSPSRVSSRIAQFWVKFSKVYFNVIMLPEVSIVFRCPWVMWSCCCSGLERWSAQVWCEDPQWQCPQECCRRAATRTNQKFSGLLPNSVARKYEQKVAKF